MAKLWTIVLFSAVVTASAQPFTQSDLGWHQGSAIWSNGVSPCSTYGTNSVALGDEGSPLIIQLHGSAGTYAITLDPNDGSLSDFDAANGIVTFTPNNAGIYNDFMSFSVTSNGCTAIGNVFIMLVATNSNFGTNCQELVDVQAVDNSSTHCITTTSNGVPTATCTTNSISYGAPFSATYCAYQSGACNGESADFSTVVYSTNLVATTGGGLYGGIQSLGSSALNVLNFHNTNTTGSATYAVQDFTFGYCNITGTNKSMRVTGLVNWDAYGPSQNVAVIVYTNGWYNSGIGDFLVFNRVLTGHEVSNSVPIALDIPLINGHVYPAGKLVIELRAGGFANAGFPGKFWGTITNTLVP